MLSLISALPTQSIAFDVPFGAFLVAGLAAVAGFGIVLQTLRHVATNPRSVTLRPVTSH